MQKIAMIEYNNFAPMSVAAVFILLSTLTSSLLVDLPLRLSRHHKLQASILHENEKNNNDVYYQDFDSLSFDATDHDFVSGLQKRVNALTRAKETEMAYGDGDAVLDLPVICFDALLPGQRLTGSTTDPVFCEVSLLLFV
jgi:hypothetical protein